MASKSRSEVFRTQSWRSALSELKEVDSMLLSIVRNVSSQLWGCQFKFHMAIRPSI